MRFLEFGLEEIRYRMRRGAWGGYGGTTTTPTRTFTPSAQRDIQQDVSRPGFGTGSEGGSARTRRGGSGGGSDEPEVEPEVDEEPEETTAPVGTIAIFTQILDQLGIRTPDTEALALEAFKKGWTADHFIAALREHRDYLANPLLKANLERRNKGERFMLEGEVINYATNIRDLARSYGYRVPADAAIAGNITTGKSLDEFRHQLEVEQRIKLFGGGVAQVWKAYTGDDPTDEELHSVFNNEINTEAFDRFARRSEMRGRPLVLNLGIRDEAEAEELERLGFTPDAAFEGYRRVAEALPSVSRLASLDKSIRDDPENPFDSFGALFGDIFRSDPKEQEKLMLMLAREKARFNTGSGAARSGMAAVGLLAPDQR